MASDFGASSNLPASAGCVSSPRPGNVSQMGWPTLAASVLTHGSCQRPHRDLGRAQSARPRVTLIGTSARALSQVVPTSARGRAATRTHRVPLSPMVRGGRREVRGVSSQAGKSPAARRSAGQPAPGYPLRLLRCRRRRRPRPGPRPSLEQHSARTAARGVECAGVSARVWLGARHCVCVPRE